MVDFLSDVIMAFGDPVVRENGHRLIEEALVRDPDLAATSPDLHLAIDSPSMFIDGRHLRAFFSAYKLVSESAGSHGESTKPFVSLFSPLFESESGPWVDADERVEDVLGSKASESQQSHAFVGFSMVLQSARALTEKIRNSNINESFLARVSKMEAELDEIESLKWNGFCTPLERIREICTMAEEAIRIMDLEGESLKRATLAVLREIDSVRGKAAPLKRKLLERFTYELSEAYRNGPVESRTVAEAYVHSAEVMNALGSMGERTTPARGRMNFRDLSKRVEVLMSEFEPIDALRKIPWLVGNSALARAAMIDAALRNRMGERSFPYKDVLAPYVSEKIVRPCYELTRLEDVKTMPGLISIADRLESAKGGNVDVYLEFAGRGSSGDAHGEMEMPLSWVRSLEPAGKGPCKFISVKGSAEQVVPFAFHRPFARKALMIMPPQTMLPSMILSAILTVKPGGAVHIFASDEPDADFDFTFLESAGYEVSMVPVGDISGMPWLQRGSGLDHVEIKIPGEDEDDSFEEGVVRLSRGGLRSLTRRNYGGVPASRGTMVALKPAGVFAAPVASVSFLAGARLLVR